MLYDAHAIRSQVPRLFEGELPQFNIGTDNGATCAAALSAAIEKICDAARFSRVTNGRFRGGWITRHYGKPENGVHAIQMELSMRGYMHEPAIQQQQSWPAPLDEELAAMLRLPLAGVLRTCIHFAANAGAAK